MRLVCCGISFHETSLGEREPVVFTDAQQRQLLRTIRATAHIHEGLALCTCNRTEFYLYVEGDADAVAFSENLIAALNAEGLDVWRRHRYVFEGMEAVNHLFRVAGGLESQMIGENQILRQVKDAYSASIAEGTSRFFLHRLLHSAFRAAKQVRTETDINAGAVSISAAAVELAAEQVSLPGADVVLLGAGENAAVAATHLVKRGIGQLEVVSRTLDSAAELCRQLKTGRPYTLDALPELMQRAALVFCSTAAEKPVITAADYAYLISQRSDPLVIIDIAVPRDVEPQIGQLDGVRLYNIEDLDRQVQANIDRRGAQIPNAEAIIAEHLDRWRQWLDSLNIHDVVRELTHTYRTLVEAEVQRYAEQFAPDQRDALHRFAASLVSKVLHGPIDYLKMTAQDERPWDQLAASELIRQMLIETRRKEKS